MTTFIFHYNLCFITLKLFVSFIISKLLTFNEKKIMRNCTDSKRHFLKQSTASFKIGNERKKQCIIFPWEYSKLKIGKFNL